MGTTRAKEIISEFVVSPRREVLVLKGRWGTGKTYTWGHLIDELAAQGKVSKPKYAYVSLFGIGSLGQLKDAVFEQTVAASVIPDGVSFATLRKNLEAVFAEPTAGAEDMKGWRRLWRKLRPAATVLNSQREDRCRMQNVYLSSRISFRSCVRHLFYQ